VSSNNTCKFVALECKQHFFHVPIKVQYNRSLNLVQNPLKQSDYKHCRLKATQSVCLHKAKTKIPFVPGLTYPPQHDTGVHF